MKTSRMNRMLSASALALALALAGCGGGGSSGSVTAPGDGGGSGTTGTDNMNPTLTMTQQAVVDAKEALDAVDTDDDDAVTSAQADYLMAAYDEMMAAREAVAALEEDEERTDALVRRDEAEMAYAEAWALDGNAEDRRRAKLRADAIGPGGTLLTDSARTEAFTVKAGTLTEMSEPAVEFGKSSTFFPPGIGDRYSGGALWRRQLADDSWQWVVPRTDKEADKPAKFSEWYAETEQVNDDGAGFNWKDRDDAIGVADGVITIYSGATPDTFKLFDFDFTMDEDDAADGYTFTGTFHGIPGKLTCASGCTAPTFDAMGMPVSIGEDWTFTPTATGDALAKLDVAAVKEDAEYLDFGSWGTWAYPESGETRDFGTFYQVSEMGTLLRTLEGEAEYKGMTTGTFAKKTENPEGMLEPTSYGAFTATVALTAKFAGRDIPANDHNMISGSITGFMDGEGNEIDETWAVTLERAAIADDGAITAGTTKAAGSMTEGKWTGAFLGGDSTVSPTVMPSAVTGTFGAHFTNGDVLGAFGAHKQ